ncbi:MAG: FAD-dependent oxidoreductase, partial [Woeseiaceae bacterium]|nr:FAD-dependent oxidoreductase [Woeseiaceae bacterium]
MAKRLNITRRDFLNGMALSLAAGTSLSPLEMLATEARRYYPPALTGMRGSHPGSFEIAHIVARTGARYSRPKQQTDATYDLVVVGGGISGLAAAYFYQQQAGRDKKVLVLDNHDDFGGHAKRNEFMVDGHHLIGYGGSMTIDGPANYSNQAKQLLRDIGIETDRFYEFFDQEFFSKRGMGPVFYFSADKYGRDVTAPNVFGGYFGDVDLSTIDSVLPT